MTFNFLSEVNQFLSLALEDCELWEDCEFWEDCEPWEDCKSLEDCEGVDSEYDLEPRISGNLIWPRFSFPSSVVVFSETARWEDSWTRRDSQMRRVWMAGLTMNLRTIVAVMIQLSEGCKWRKLMLWEVLWLLLLANL